MTTFEALAAQRTKFLDDIEASLDTIDMCKETLYRVAGSAAEASAQSALSRANAHYDAIMQAFDDWIDSDIGAMYDQLESQQ